MSLSNFLETELLDHVFNNAAYTSPTNVFVKLHIGNPGEDCTGNPATHTTREQASFGNASSGAIANDTDLEFDALAADETISHFSVWDHISAGNPLGYGALADPQDVNAGGLLRFSAGQLDITFD